MTRHDVRPLAESDLEQFVDELWIPAQREMATYAAYDLADDIREDGIQFRRSRLSEDDSTTLLAHRDDRLLGYVSGNVETPPPIFRQVRECHVGELYVREEVRREGLATDLLAAIEDWAEDRDCESVRLNVDEGNRAAKELYERRGYGVERRKLRKSLTE